MENNENQIQENVVEETVPSEIAINNDDKKIKTSKKKENHNNSIDTCFINCRRNFCLF